MCGILGVFSPEGAAAAEPAERALQTLHHRGPDGQRLWTSDDRRVVLGHARLSIIDLETGAQPILNEAGDACVVVNGEFYDHRRLQRSLTERGHRLRTRSDSEVALHLYEELGVACLRELRGEFAFILWDQSNRQLLAARDRFGVKPLYYAQRGTTLYLASEVQALFAMGVAPRWSRFGMYDHLSFMVEQGESLFEGVRQVPPGHVLLASAQGVRLVRYWDWEFPAAGDRQEAVPFDEQVTGVRRLLEESVRLRLEADVPVACYLSGGIDSAAALGLASHVRGSPVDAFTVCFEDPSFDEGGAAKKMAAHVGARYHPLVLTQDALVDALPAAVQSAGQPFGNFHAVSKFLLSAEVRRQGFKVVLTGEGADEVFAGYVHFRRDMVLHNLGDQPAQRRTELLEQLRQLDEQHHGTFLPAEATEAGATARRLLGFVPSFLDGTASIGDRYRSLMRPELKAALQRRDPLRVFLSSLPLEEQVLGRAPLHQVLYLWAKSCLPGYLLTVLGDRMEMAHSVEGRPPFLDHVLAEAVARLPPASKIHGLTEKHVFREATRPFITEAAYRQVKRPFLAPSFWDDAKGRLRELAMDHFHGPGLRDQPFFEPGAVLALMESLPTRVQRDRRLGETVLLFVLGVCVLQQRLRLA